MKATELMIGDIVMFKHQHYPTRIKVIDNTHCMPFEDMKISGWVKYGGLEDIEPIPLNPEILEKNGFEKYAMYHTLHDKRVHVEYYWHESRLEIQPYDGEPWIRIAPIRYVHTLQQAFRLCGLTDLADNFKI